MPERARSDASDRRDGPGDGADEQVPRWLDAQEMAAWLPLLRVIQLLPQSLDRQLREQTGINHTYYMLLAILSGRPDHEMTLSQLASASGMIPSRLTHALGSLESRGWVERRPCPGDRRVQFARLTESGQALLAEVAPGHVAQVRRTVIDVLDREDLAHLARIAGKVAAALEE